MRWGLPLFLFCSWANGQSLFSTPPSANFQNGQYTITFAVSAASDVDIAVVDSTGRIVRHLAAGMLGGQNVPPTPLVAGFSQSILWDGRDDAGLSLTSGGPFKIRVRRGLTPAWQYSINTNTIPGSHRAGAVIRPRLWEETVQLTNPIFHRIRVEHSSPDLDIAVNDINEQLFIKVTNGYSTDQYRYKGADGSALGLVRFGTYERQYWGEIAFAWDGSSIFHSTSLDPIYRYSPDGKPATWTGGKGSVTGLAQGFTHSRGQAVGPDGHLYVLHHGGHRYWGRGVVTDVDTSGNVARSGFIDIAAPVGGGIRIDPKGNIFVGARIKPKGQRMPPGLDTLVSNTGEESLGWWAEEMYGSLLKFPPSGGKIIRGQDGGLDLGVLEAADSGGPAYSDARGASQGLSWMYYGLSPAQTHNTSGAKCICNVARFDVDRFGRVFIPDAFRISIVILDNNGNFIRRFSFKDMPVIQTPIAWPHQVEATDRAFYIADQINNMVAAVEIKAAEEVLLDLPTSVENGAGGAGMVHLSLSPNPFRTLSKLQVALPKGAERGNLSIYGTQGKRVKTLFAGRFISGTQAFSWDGSDAEGQPLGSGVYIVRFSLPGLSFSRPLMLVRRKKRTVSWGSFPLTALLKNMFLNINCCVFT